MNELCRVLEWDSAFFSRRIARVVPERIDSRQADEVMRWCEKERIECAYFLSGDPDSLREASRIGFQFVDVRYELEWNGNGAVEPADLRAYRTEDLPAMEEIARTAFRQSRFYKDEQFGRDKADQLYIEWTRKCAANETVLIAEVDERVGGFISVDVAKAHIGLLAVSEDTRGRGLGSRLVRGVQRLLLDRGTGRCGVVTQGVNVPALRTYTGRGFRNISNKMWYHQWFGW